MAENQNFGTEESDRQPQNQQPTEKQSRRPGQETGASQPSRGPAGEEPQPERVSQDARIIALLCHLLGLFTNFLGPLIIFLAKKGEDAFIEKNAREALNFQITMLIGIVIAIPLSWICVGILLLFAITVTELVLCIVAVIKANEGMVYKYPVSIRFIK